jgi:hypothetical protein
MIHIDIQSSDDIFPAVEELIKLFNRHPTSKLSAILDQRMHKVAWTTGDELLEELRSVLTRARRNEVFDANIHAQVDQIVLTINEKLKR